MIRNIIAGFCVLFCIVLMPSDKAYALEATYGKALIETNGFSSEKNLIDDNTNTYAKAAEGNEIVISLNEGIGALYIKFDQIPTEWTLTNASANEQIICGKNAFLHEFVDVKELFDTLPEKLILTFEEDTVIADVYAFSDGDIPKWVQIWQPPCETADLLLISSHSDDEQLFFLGVLPYYAGELKMNVQVAYVIQHFEVNGVLNHQRPHEQLDGLWTVGVRNYPVMSDFPDLYAQSKDRAVAFSEAEKVFENAGVTYDDFIGYMTECIRRFKPSVVVSHDLDGEYGHGTHVLAAAALTEAIKATADETQYPESAEKYGVWDIEKLYLHLYKENEIVMNYDIPLDNFNGKTAYEVSCEGFACHKSQHWTWFYKWIYGSEENPYTKATQIRTYSPCKYGLYYTNVGVDTEGGDFFENVVTHEESVRVKIEEAMKQIIDAKDKMRGVF